MPIYEYACPDCGHEFERLQKMSEDPVKDCPECHNNQVKKKVSMTSFVLKGSGWYKDHYGLKSNDAPSSDSSSSTSSESTTESSSSESSSDSEGSNSSASADSSSSSSTTDSSPSSSSSSGSDSSGTPSTSAN